MSSKKITAVSIGQNTIKQDVSGLSSGVYIVEVLSDAEVLRTKIIKQ